MRKQSDDGIKVYVIREEDVRECENFAVIDNMLIEYGSYVNLGSKHVESKLSFNRYDIDVYHKQFSQLRNQSLTLSQWLNKHCRNNRTCQPTT